MVVCQGLTSRQPRGSVRVVEVDHHVAVIVNPAAGLRAERDEEAVAHTRVDVEIDAVVIGLTLLAVDADALFAPQVVLRRSGAVVQEYGDRIAAAAGEARIRRRRDGVVHIVGHFPIEEIRPHEAVERSVDIADLRRHPRQDFLLQRDLGLVVVRAHAPALEQVRVDDRCRTRLAEVGVVADDDRARVHGEHRCRRTLRRVVQQIAVHDLSPSLSDQLRLTVATIVAPLFVDVNGGSFDAKPRYLPQRSFRAVLPVPNTS